MSTKVYKPKPRTLQQNRALHKWIKQKSDQCRAAGISQQAVLNHTIELEMTETQMKEIWRSVQKALYGKKSTTELTKNEGEIDEIYRHLERFFGREPFFLPSIPFPSHCEHEMMPEECILCERK